MYASLCRAFRSTCGKVVSVPFMQACNVLQTVKDKDSDSNDGQATDHMQEDSFFTTGMHRWQTRSAHSSQSCQSMLCAVWVGST